MTELDQHIAKAFASSGEQKDVNKLYTSLLRQQLFVPVSLEPPTDPEEPFMPLFMEYQDKYFLLAFDTFERLQAWAGELMNEMNYVELTGRDLIRAVGNQVILALNYGNPYYKEFAPDEIVRLKTIVAKLDDFAKKSG